jgi:hypothetical protein
MAEIHMLWLMVAQQSQKFDALCKFEFGSV